MKVVRLWFINGWCSMVVDDVWCCLMGCWVVVGRFRVSDVGWLMGCLMFFSGAGCVIVVVDGVVLWWLVFGGVGWWMVRDNI